MVVVVVVVVVMVVVVVVVAVMVMVVVLAAVVVVVVAVVVVVVVVVVMVVVVVVVVVTYTLTNVPADSPSHGGDIVVHVKNIKQPSLPTPFYSVLVSMSVFRALSTVFHSTSSPGNSALSNSVLPVLILPYWSFQLCISKVSLNLNIMLSGDWA